MLTHLNNKGRHLSSIVRAAVIEHLLPLSAVTILQGSSIHIFKIRKFWEVKWPDRVTELGFKSGTSDPKAKLFFIPMTKPGLPVSSVWGAWYHYPCNLNDTYGDLWGVFAASKTQDQCTRHLLWSWDIICWPISFALFWPSSWSAVSVLAGARWGPPNPWELCSFGPEPCQFHGRESSNSPPDFCRFLWFMLYGLFLSKVPVVCTAFTVLSPLSLSQS